MKHTGVQNPILQLVVSSVLLLISHPLCDLWSCSSPLQQNHSNHQDSKEQWMKAWVLPLGKHSWKHEQYFNTIYLSAPWDFLIYKHWIHCSMNLSHRWFGDSVHVQHGMLGPGLILLYAWLNLDLDKFCFPFCEIASVQHNNLRDPKM